MPTTVTKRLPRSAATTVTVRNPKARLVPGRLNLSLSRQAYAEVTSLSEQTCRPLPDLVRLGLDLVKIAIEESRKNNKLIVTTADGRPVKQLTLPAL